MEINEELLTEKEEQIGEQIAAFFYTQTENFFQTLEQILSQVESKRRELVLSASVMRLYNEQTRRREYLGAVLGIEAGREQVEFLLFEMRESDVPEEHREQFWLYKTLGENLARYELEDWYKKTAYYLQAIVSAPSEELESLKTELERYKNDFYQTGYRSMNLFKPQELLLELLKKHNLLGCFSKAETVIETISVSEYLFWAISAELDLRQKAAESDPRRLAIATFSFRRLIK